MNLNKSLNTKEVFCKGEVKATEKGQHRSGGIAIAIAFLVLIVLFVPLFDKIVVRFNIEEQKAINEQCGIEKISIVEQLMTFYPKGTYTLSINVTFEDGIEAPLKVLSKVGEGKFKVIMDIPTNSPIASCVVKVEPVD